MHTFFYKRGLLCGQDKGNSASSHFNRHVHINYFIHYSPKGIRLRIFFGKMSRKERGFAVVREENRQSPW